jgi:hypothetical protein
MVVRFASLDDVLVISVMSGKFCSVMTAHLRLGHKCVESADSQKRLAASEA